MGPKNPFTGHIGRNVAPLAKRGILIAIALLLGFVISACVEPIAGYWASRNNDPDREIRFSERHGRPICEGSMGRLNLAFVSWGAPRDLAWEWSRMQEGKGTAAIFNYAASFQCDVVERLEFDGSINGPFGLALDIYGARRAGLKIEDLESYLAASSDKIERALTRLQMEGLTIRLAIICGDRSGGESFAFAGLANGSPMVTRAVVPVPCDSQPATGETRSEALTSQLTLALGIAFHEATHIKVAATEGGNRDRLFQLANEALAAAVQAEWDGEGLHVPAGFDPNSTPGLCAVVSSLETNVSGLLDPEGGEAVYRSDGMTEGGRSDVNSTAQRRLAIAEAIQLSGGQPIAGENVNAVIASQFLDRWGTRAGDLREYLSEQLRCP